MKTSKTRIIALFLECWSPNEKPRRFISSRIWRKLDGACPQWWLLCGKLCYGVRREHFVGRFKSKARFVQIAA